MTEYGQHSETSHDRVVDDPLAYAVLTIWKYRFFSILIFSVITTIGLVHCVTRDRVYEVNAMLVRASADAESSGPTITSPFSSFVSVSQKGGAVDRGKEALLVLKSKSFSDGFLRERGLLPELFPDAVRGGEKVSIRQATAYWQSIFSITEDDEGLVKAGIVWRDRQQAYQWLLLVVQDINQYMRSKAIEQANENIEYLQREIEKTPVLEMRQVLYELMRAETKDAMLANTKEQFVFRYVDPPVVLDEGQYYGSTNKNIMVFFLLFSAVSAIFSPIILNEIHLIFLKIKKIKINSR